MSVICGTVYLSFKLHVGFMYSCTLVQSTVVPSLAWYYSNVVLIELHFMLLLDSLW